MEIMLILYCFQKAQLHNPCSQQLVWTPSGSHIDYSEIIHRRKVYPTQMNTIGASGLDKNTLLNGSSLL